MRCLLVSWGSHGDLHPFLALGRGLVSRGHAVTLVGHPEWAAETEAAGLRFVATVEPPRDDFAALHPEIMSARWGGLSSLRALIRYGMEPSFEPILAALLREAPGHDVIVAHHFVFSASVAAELTGKPLLTVTLAPSVEPSAYSRPGPNFGRAGYGLLARALNRIIWSGGRMVTRLTVDPAVNRLRRRHGLRPVRDAVFSIPASSLRLYSGHFAPRPPDWSVDCQPIGFCFYDPPDALPVEVEKFIAAGEPPILFTLGSAAVQIPGEFYRNGAEALRLLGWRGIFLIGAEKNRPPNLGDHVLAISYAPFGALMPRVRAAVHQGGIGTLSQALRAGLPSVVCPFAFDQPNNARRLEGLGVGKMLRPHQRSAREIAGALRRMLVGNAPVRARQLARLIRSEDGVVRACTRVEQVTSPFS